MKNSVKEKIVAVKVKKDVSTGLGAQDNFLLRVIEHMDEAILIADVNGYVKYVNACFEKMTEFSRYELIDKEFFLLADTSVSERDDKVSELYNDLWKTIKEGKVWCGEFTDVRKGGKDYPVEVTISPVFDSTGTIINYVCLRRDITEKNRIKEELKQSQENFHQLQKIESIGKLAGGVAHDFNNLLQVITGNLAFAKEEIGEKNAAAVKDIDQALEGCDRAATLTQSLLAYSRKQQLHPEVINLNTLLSKNTHFFERILGEQISLDVTCEKELWNINADLHLFENIVMNLLVNAKDAMEDHGTLTIQTQNIPSDERIDIDSYRGMKEYVLPREEYVKLSIKDTGCGIPNEILKKIFDPFFTTKEMGKGTGLGLSLVYGTVRQSGGYINVMSKIGKGTTVDIYLPRCSEEKTEDSQPTDQESPKENKDNKVILVVEDEPAVRELSVRALRRLGYKVYEAADAQEAFSVIDNKKICIDLLLTDVILPGGKNGAEVSQYFIQKCPKAKTIFMSGYSDEIIGKKGVISHRETFISKPFNHDELLIKVSRSLNGETRGERQQRVVYEELI